MSWRIWQCVGRLVLRSFGLSVVWSSSLGCSWFSWSLSCPDKRQRYELREYVYTQNTFGRLIDFNMRRDDRASPSLLPLLLFLFITSTIIIVIHKSYAPYLNSTRVESEAYIHTIYLEGSDLWLTFHLAIK